MNKKKYAIIGKPLSHSLSPTLHNYWFKKYNIDAEYTLLEIEENQIKSVVDKIEAKELSGINITLPYKKKIAPYLNKIINDAKETHSVNTVFVDNDNSITGENTDVFGLQAGYLKEVISENKRNKKTLILGAGGLAPSVVVSLRKSNVNDITISNRTHEKSLFLKNLFPNIKIIKWEDCLKEAKNFDIIINATSLGLKGGEEFNHLLDQVKPELVYIDTIYNPLKTKTIKHLNSKNIKTFNGLDMFIYQGQKSFYIWNKINPEVDQELINLLENKIK